LAVTPKWDASLREAFVWLLAAGARFLSDSTHGGAFHSSGNAQIKSKKLTGVPVSFS
jgi:hypothetical protein